MKKPDYHHEIKAARAKVAGAIVMNQQLLARNIVECHKDLEETNRIVGEIEGLKRIREALQ